MKLELGCGVILTPGFTNVDIIDPKLVKGKGKYIQADIRKLPFEDNVAEVVQMFSVLEHFGFREQIDVVKEVYRVMKPGGKLLVVTDDFDGIVLDWFRMRIGPFNLDNYQSVMETVYGNQHHEGEFHKCCMTPDFLNWVLVSAGFTKGTFTKLGKGTTVPRIGTKKGNKKAVFRNDQILLEADK